MTHATLADKLPLITDIVDALGVLKGDGRIRLKQELVAMEPNQLRQIRGRVSKYTENLGYAERVRLTHEMIKYLQSNPHLPAESENRQNPFEVEPAYMREGITIREMQERVGCHLIDPSSPPPMEPDSDLEFKPATISPSAPRYADQSYLIRKEIGYQGPSSAACFDGRSHPFE